MTRNDAITEVDTLAIWRRGAAHHDAMTVMLDAAFDRALSRESCLSDHTLKMSGMSGVCYRHFINNLVRLTPRARYLEVGSWAGSTACSAMDRNVATVLCIDNWSEFGGPRKAFFDNIEAVKGPYIDFDFIEADFRAVDLSGRGKFNLYLFDGPHSEKDQYDGLALYREALDDDFYFFVDDWNWDHVRRGTFNAIKDAGFTIDYRVEVRTTLDNKHTAGHTVDLGSDWHNGYFLSKLSRR